jgi:hypothetical protein
VFQGGHTGLYPEGAVMAENNQTDQPTANLPLPNPESEHFRPSEDDRLQRAKEWLRVARGETPTKTLFDENKNA